MKILTYPNPILTQVSEPVDNFDGLDTFCDEMYETMLENDGAGLSAVQVGVLKRILVVDVGEGRLDIINPQILSITKMPFRTTEGCLSVPGHFENRERPEGIELKYNTPGGEEIVDWFTGLEAFCIQHEMDHLDGKLFIDDLSPLKKDRIRKKIVKTLRRK